MSDIDYHKLYEEETGWPVFTMIDGYEQVTWQYYEWKIRKLAADRDRWKAEVNEYKDASEDWESIARSMTQERDAMTALAERYNHLLDDAISLLMNSRQRDELWDSDYEELLSKYNKIKEADNE